MNDQSGYCVSKWDKTTGVELSPVKVDCSAEFTISENEKTFFLISHGEGDCAAGFKMNVKIPPCQANIGYAVAPSKLLAAGGGGKNAAAANGTFAVVPAAKTFNASAAEVAKAVEKAPLGAAASVASSSGSATAGFVAAVTAAAAVAVLVVVA
jgi:hypothetical protein